jgi:FkbM family methyltransferase
VFCSDDQVFLRPIRFSEMKPLYYGDITNRTEWNGGWWWRMAATRDALVRKSCKVVRNYDSHCPTPMDRDTFAAVAQNYDYAPPPGYTINTLYCNAANVEGVPVRGWKHTAEAKENDEGKILAAIKGKTFIGYSDAGLTPALKKILAKTFPTSSPFEIRPPEPSAITTPPPQRGIVTLAGGPIYTLNAYINCRLLRYMGCTLPIEWCYLGVEMSEEWKHRIQSTIPDVRLVDLGGVRTNNAKRRGGWQSKVAAIRKSEFEELLFLDADSFPQRNPTYLFDHPFFRERDCVFWPDLRRLSAKKRNWVKSRYGIDLGRQEIESGQMLFHKAACAKALAKTQELNDNSEEVYRVLHGDKDTFLAGAIHAGVRWAIVPHRVRRDGERNLIQMDFDGKPAFTHLTGGKWTPLAQAVVGLRDFPFHAEAARIHLELQLNNATGARERCPMKTRNDFCAFEVEQIIARDMYEIRPLVGHRVPVRFVVDIGGNAGAFTVAASNLFPAAHIIVVEPDADLMSDIRENTRNCKATIHYVEKACVGRAVDRVRFVKPIGRPQGNYVRGTAWDSEQRRGEETYSEIDVAAVTLPHLLSQYAFPTVDVLKIDAEGVEGEVLLSLRDSEWLPRVHWIRGEWHGLGTQQQIEDALRATHVWHLQKGLTNGSLIAHNKMDS